MKQKYTNRANLFKTQFVGLMHDDVDRKNKDQESIESG